MKTVFVGNLKEEMLRSLFENYGQVEQIHMIPDLASGLPHGFAYVVVVRQHCLVREESAMFSEIGLTIFGNG